MRGFHNNSFDPQTLVVLETAFDEAWLTLKLVDNKTVKPDELARFCVAHGDGRRARSRPIARRSAGATAARDQLARGELIASSDAGAADRLYASKRVAAFLPHVRGAYLRNRPGRGIIAGAGGRHLARADNLA